MIQLYRLREVCSLRKPAAVAVIDGPVGLHAGILHEDENGAWWLTDLAWHFKLRRRPLGDVLDDPREVWAFPLPAVDEIDLGVVSLLCARVASRNHAGIPYSFLPGATFERDTGVFMPTARSHGLTCSTFVLEVFRAAGVDLVDLTSWAALPEDLEVQRELVQYLRRGGASPAHVASVERETGCVRLRAEEVAASTTLAPLPASYVRVAPAGEALRRSYRMLATRPATP